MFFIWIFDRYFAITFKHSQLIQGSVGSWVWSAPIGRVPEMWDYAGSWLQLSPGFCNTPVYSGGSSWPWSQRELILGLLAITGNCGEDSFTCLPNPISFDCAAVSQGVLVVKNLAASGGDVRHLGSIPESERSPGEGNGNPLQYFCLENPTDRQAWRAMVHRVAMNKTRLKRLSTHIQLELTNCVTDSGQWNVGRSDGLIWPLKLPHNPLCFLFPRRKKSGSPRACGAETLHWHACRLECEQEASLCSGLREVYYSACPPLTNLKAMFPIWPYFDAHLPSPKWMTKFSRARTMPLTPTPSQYAAHKLANLLSLLIMMIHYCFPELNYISKVWAYHWHFQTRAIYSQGMAHPLGNSSSRR